jgi:glyoxylase-like metal-dependent hydrolase (beta-lactamase superfamily II)
MGAAEHLNPGRAPLSAELTFKKTMEFEYGVAAELAPGVRRLVAGNPGPFTFKGTNTYLVGTDDLALIDPGPDDDAHIEAILRAAGGRPITHVLITHTHRDHTDGLAKVLRATGAATCGYGRTAPTPGDVRASPSGAEFVDQDFRPDIVMRAGYRVSGPGWTLEAVYTPGHAPDHLCFALADRRLLFSGDHVMAWNTTVVAPPEGNMADYMNSLDLLLGRAKEDDLYLPGHGGRIDNPGRVVKAFIVHRTWREQAILGAIRDGTNNVREIVSRVYQDLDGRLVTAACLSVQAHVEYLISRGLVRCDGPPTFDQPLFAV